MATNAPASTYVIVTSIVVTFCTFGWVIIFLPSWYWYLIPAVAITPAIAVLAQRWMRRHRIKTELRATLEQLG